MNQIHKTIKNLTITVIVLIVFFCLSLAVEKVFKTYSPIPALFALAVFFVSLVTEGYYYGIIASLLSVLALNFAFTFPYFKFNFTIPENMVSAFIMLSITITSSTLTTKIKKIEKMEAETEKETYKTLGYCDASSICMLLCLFNYVVAIVYLYQLSERAAAPPLWLFRIA